MRRSAAINPSNAQLHERIGLLLLRQDKYSESRDAFAKALEVAENQPDIQSSVSSNYFSFIPGETTNSDTLTTPKDRLTSTWELHLKEKACC